MQADLSCLGLSEESALVERLKTGAPGAIDEVVRLYHRPLFSFIVRMIGDPQEAEDIFQETWVRVIRHVGSFRGQSRFSTWLFQIALNQCRNAMRKLGRRQYVDIDEVSGQDENLTVGPDVDAGKIIAAERVKRMLASLPPRMREVLVLRYYHDRSEQEIAEITGKPVGTVKSRIHRATNMLREKMGTF
ncbi:MAG: RNA polymerase sigma factor [Gemmatimonadota bacterium]|nr:RNA polymerase sigma factor [Gemmatimonadota bacterium]